MNEAVNLCASIDLVDGGKAVGFDVVHVGQPARAFAIRYQGKVHAYLNRCSHIPMEMDYQEGQFFDDTGRWLLCSTHGAVYEPDSGACVGGPCRGGLVKIHMSESNGVVHWHTDSQLKPVDF